MFHFFYLSLFFSRNFLLAPDFGLWFPFYVPIWNRSEPRNLSVPNYNSAVFFLTELGDVVPKRCKAWNLRKDSFRKGMEKNRACPSAWPGIGAYSSSLQPAGPIPGLRRAGGMCQEKWLIYNIIRQHLSLNINKSPGKRARFILVNQELSWN